MNAEIFSLKLQELIPDRKKAAKNGVESELYEELSNFFYTQKVSDLTYSNELENLCINFTKEIRIGDLFLGKIGELCGYLTYGMAESTGISLNKENRVIEIEHEEGNSLEISNSIEEFLDILLICAEFQSKKIEGEVDESTKDKYIRRIRERINERYIGFYINIL